MLFPFRSRSLFRNRWIALLWAAGICFTATEIVDSLSGITGKTAPAPASPSSVGDDTIAAVLDGKPTATLPPPGSGLALDKQAR